MSNVFPSPPAHQPWLRIWMPEKDWNANPGMDDGFLPDAFGDPEPLAADSSSKAGALQAFSQIPFLFLLGRPGSGKSRELLQAHQQRWLGSSRWIEGKEFSSDIAATLDRVVAGATGPTRLFIDGLDEALLEHANFVPKLKRWLLDHHLGPNGEPTIHLAITCRWADWPVQSVSELANLWQADRTQCLILCPLRRSDAVRTITDRFGTAAADQFWQQMYDHHLSSVACWPQGLLGLLEQFEQSGRKSVCAGYSQAIEEQISRYCRLTDSPDDAARWETGVSGADWRRRVAGRLAVAMLWSGKNRLNLRLTGVSADSLTVADFKDHAEPWEHNHKAVRLDDLDDLVHKTRLLRRLSYGDVWVFDSQVHQEALAAEWLNAQNLDLPRFEQLFGREDEGRWRVQPALGAVAAWLAGQNTQFRQLVLKHDPLILLRMDGARISNSDRKDIVEALLVATEQIRVLDPVFRQAHLASLAHPDLPAQLESWLRRPDVSVATQELALEIAEKAQQKTLAPVLWELYPQTTGSLQNEMAGALYRLSDAAEYDSKWQMVLRGDNPVYNEGTLLGAAIKFLILTGKRPIADALQWLIPGRYSNVYLFYTVVLALPEKITVDDLPAVFAKLAEQPELLHDTLETPYLLHKSAVRLAIAHFERPEIARALCDYWHSCLAHHVSPHKDVNSTWNAVELGVEDDSRRHNIIRALILHPRFESHSEKKWFWSDEYMVTDEDFDWGLNEAFLSAPENRWRWALMLTSSLWRTDLTGERAARLKDAWAAMPEIRSILPAPAPNESFVEAIIRLSQEHRFSRESERAKQKAARDKHDQKFQADLQRYTQDCKRAHEEGGLTWGGVTNILSARIHGRGPCAVTFEPISKIGPDDKWMIESAIRYLIKLPDKEPLELKDGIGGLLALAACLPCVAENADLRESIGRHWLAPMLSDFSMSSLGKVPEGISLERFAEWFPDQLPAALETVVRHRYLNKGELYELSSFQNCWSEKCSLKLAGMLRNEPVQVEGFFNAVRMLAAQNESLAVDLIRFWINKEKHEKLSDDQRAAVAGAALLLFNGRCVEEVFCNGLVGGQEDLQVARDAIWLSIRMLDFDRRRIDFSNWSDISIRLVAELSWSAYTRTRQRSSGAFFRELTAEDDAIDFRDRIISEATQRGIYLNLPVTVDGDTPEEAASRQHSVDWHRNEASKARRKASRDLLPPDALFRLCNTPNARLARDPDELMAAVIASVRRWEQSLLTGKWRHLWDLKPLRARGEEDIAKELRDWLRADLDILVEREVELYSEHRTDVLVQTLPQAGDKLTVLIELKKVRKGNAKERRSAMQTQLRDTYLQERLSEGWTHGLFIIAWTSEPGHKLNADSAMQEEAAFLTKQAETLSEPPFVLKSMIVDARSH